MASKPLFRLSDCHCGASFWDTFYISYLIYFRTCYYVLDFEVLEVVTMKSTIFWDVTACSLVEVCKRFRGKYCVHRVSQASNKHTEPLILCLLFNPEDGRSTFLRNASVYQTIQRHIPQDSTLHVFTYLLCT
jgi:hypothetical protein